MKTFLSVSLYAAAGLALGFLLAKHQARLNSVECRIEGVVTEPAEGKANFQGVERPYTIVVHQPPHRTYLVPGVLGKPGEFVYVLK